MADMRQMMVDSIIFQMNHSSSNSRRYFKTLNKCEIPQGISKKDGYIEDVIEFKKYLENLTDEDFLQMLLLIPILILVVGLQIFLKQLFT